MTDKIVELDEELELGEDEVEGSLDASPKEDIEEEEQVEEEQDALPDLPEKFKGKKLEDIVESYRNLEREYGRRNSEIGELRRLTDKLLNLQEKELNKGKEVEEVDVDAFLENPSTAIDKALESNPRLKAIEEQFINQKLQTEKQAFEAEHPDWVDVVTSDGFQKWVKSSPVRMKMFQEADQNYDYATGGELIGLYKQLTQEKTKEAEQEQTTKRKADMKKVSTEKGSGTPASKKIYRRADLINLRITNPSRYEAMEDEILAAYAEGRVR